jgi:hypothetical protein
MTSIDGFYTVSEFIRIFAVPRTSFYRYAQSGQLRLTKLNRATRIAKADAQAWAASLPTIGGEA